MPEEVFERVRAHCESLPETTVRSDAYAHAFQIRLRIFVCLAGVPKGDGTSVSVLGLRADPDERRFLLASGHPYFPSNSGVDRLGIILDDDTDWDQVCELITDSYRLMAPKKLSAQLD